METQKDKPVGMKGYVKQKCKEQRQLCYEQYVGTYYRPEMAPPNAKHILDAQEPNLDESPSPSDHADCKIAADCLAVAEKAFNAAREYETETESPREVYDTFQDYWNDVKDDPEYKSLNIADQPLPDAGKIVDWDVMFEDFKGDFSLSATFIESIFNWFKSRPEFQQGRFTENSPTKK